MTSGNIRKEHEMQSKKKASAPSYHTPSARMNRIENDASTIIPFERKQRPTAKEMQDASQFKAGVLVGFLAASSSCGRGSSPRWTARWQPPSRPTRPRRVSSMRNDERYSPKPQSNQLEIFGLGFAGEQDFQEARKWIENNPGAWNFMVENAVRLNRKGYVSVNYLVNMVRNELHVACKNGIAPSLARIMEARYPQLKGAFNKHRSQSDGFSE